MANRHETGVLAETPAVESGVERPRALDIELGVPRELAGLDDLVPSRPLTPNERRRLGLDRSAAEAISQRRRPDERR